MTRRPRPRPPKGLTHSTLTKRSSHSTIDAGTLDAFGKPPLGARPARPPKPARLSRRQVARIADDEESSLLDVIDNLLSKGVVLNADLILALADVDLVYVRLSTLLCAADRVLPRRRGGPIPPKPRSGEGGT